MDGGRHGQALTDISPAHPTGRLPARRPARLDASATSSRNVAAKPARCATCCTGPHGEERRNVRLEEERDADNRQAAALPAAQLCGPGSGRRRGPWPRLTPRPGRPGGEGHHRQGPYPPLQRDSTWMRDPRGLRAAVRPGRGHRWAEPALGVPGRPCSTTSTRPPASGQRRAARALSVARHRHRPRLGIAGPARRSRSRPPPATGRLPDRPPRPRAQRAPPPCPPGCNTAGPPRPRPAKTGPPVCPQAAAASAGGRLLRIAM